MIHDSRFNPPAPLTQALFQDGWSAVMWAATKGYTDIVEVLVSAGANLNIQNKVRSSVINV